MNRLTATLLLAASALVPATLPVTPATAQAVSRPTQDIVLSIGRGQLITVPGMMTDLFVANDTIADVQVKSQNQLYVFGKAGGETTVYASDRSGTVIWSANLRVGSNIDSIDQMLSLAMPEARIAVSTVGSNTVLLTGTIAAPEDAAEAERLVQAFVGEGATIISRLRMATPLQVNLQVKFAEVSRSLVRTIGTNLTSIDSTGGFQFGIGKGRGGTQGQLGPGRPLGVGGATTYPTIDPATGEIVRVPGASVTTAGPGATLGAAGRLFGLDLLGALDLGEQIGLVTTLSQPTLTALSGETAEFLAGGEFPIPLAQGLGTTTVDYKQYGVSLAYSPTVLANGRISIRVRPEVSELSSTGAIVLNGFQVPALTTRRAETTIELGSGQSFMIAGLMSNSAQNAIEKAPGLGDIPILGNLFRSTNFRKGETELVIVVTPYLVEPVNARDIALPTDGFRSPDEASRWIGFQENAGVSGQGRPVPQAAPPIGPSEPMIGQAITPPPAPAAPARDARDRRASRRDATKTAAKAGAAAPGFSFE